MKKHTNEAIVDVNDYIYNALDNGSKYIGIFIDLIKVFDTVDHKIFIHKLEILEIRVPKRVPKQIKSYLTNDRHRVHIGSSLSYSHEVKCDVPQGDIFGPILFLIYRNNIINRSQVFNSLFRI